MLRAAVVALITLVLAAGPADARTADDVRVPGTCSKGVAAELRLKPEERRIELRFKLRQTQAGGAWRVALVQERRVVWKGTLRTRRQSRSFELRRVLQDLPGHDTVTASAWGPRGLGCRATATLAED
jgi:hypothetical protein